MNKSVVALIGLGLLWGLTIPLSKIAVSSGHPPLGLLVWQLIFSTLALLPLCVLRQRWPGLSRRLLYHYLIVALIGTVLPNGVAYFSISRLPAGIMAIIIASVPMFALLIALLLRAERLQPGRAIGVLVGAAAVVLLVGPDASLPEPGLALFVLIALIAPFCYGLETNYLASFAPRDAGPLMTLFGASLCGTLLTAPLAAASGAWLDLSAPWGKPEWALLASSLIHVATYLGYIWLAERAGAVFTSQLAYLVTLSGVFASALILGERYTIWVWAALALMLTGLALVQPRAPDR